MMSKQRTGGDAKPLENSFTTGGYSRSKSNAPKISGTGGGNVTGPAITNQKGKQGNG